MNPARSETLVVTGSDPAASPGDHAEPSVTIERAGDLDAVAWNAYVERAADASVYHLYEWRKLIRQVFGHEGCYLAARDPAGAICGVLPIVRLRSRLFGDFMVSMPYFNYGGVAADTPSIATALLTAAVQHAREAKVSHLELRHCSQAVCSEWPLRTDKVAMHLRLPESAEALSKQLGSKLRSQIKRPTREGATCKHGGLELLDEFYAVFAENMRDLGTPVYSKRFFAAVLTEFAQCARLFVVHLRNKPVAAGFVIGHKKRLEIPWASSLREANAIGVNMLLYWNVLEYACTAGYETFDFGRSTQDAGTYRFKKQWGAEPQQLYWHYWMRNGGAPPQLNHSNPKFRLAVSAWQKLPLAVANRLGPFLVKNLP